MMPEPPSEILIVFDDQRFTKCSLMCELHGCEGASRRQLIHSGSLRRGLLASGFFLAGAAAGRVVVENEIRVVQGESIREKPRFWRGLCPIYF
jgi:hypothetical protein